MKIKNVTHDEIPQWESLSREYDGYVKELVPDLTLWYEGNETLPSFDVYMKRRIDNHEAFMATNDENDCLGIIAISKRNNNITFFAVSHKYDLDSVGGMLLQHGLAQLDKNTVVKINELDSNAEQITKVFALLDKFQFTYLHNEWEHGVPVKCLGRIPNKPNKIIIVGGFPATGKSTFSRGLSLRLKLPCFNKDTIKEVMGDGFGIENAELINRNKKGSEATFKLMLHIAERFMQTGNACILESNFSELYPQPLSESNQLKQLVEKYNYDCLTFAFTGDPDVLGQRYADRDNERHWVHEKVAGAKDVIKDYCTRTKLDEIEIGQTIKVDTTVFENVDFEALYKTAEKFITLSNYSQKTTFANR
ncbi:MAG: ATP-binding protein [Defluviitaleaceae bacterium]|nr:ATP-binding protein [Defluviitaleaceae bacterium]